MSVKEQSFKLAADVGTGAGIEAVNPSADGQLITVTILVLRVMLEFGMWLRSRRAERKAKKQERNEERENPPAEHQKKCQ